jgi:chemotaxis protein methyltransferase CheR
VPERTLHLLRDLIHAKTGLFYEDDRLGLLLDRLSPLVLERGFDSMLDYYYLLKYDEGTADDWMRAIDALSVQETYFWRELDQVRALVDAIVPKLLVAHRRALRIWSIPCATGEEPLSLAIALNEAGWFGRASIEIHASDASRAALQRAAAGLYGERAFRQLPQALREKYFVREGNQSRVAPDLHARVTSWSRVNVVSREEVAARGTWDVIFCRNLFIYFDSPTVQRVVGTFAEMMPDGGYLCVGAAESLLRLNTPFELEDVGGAYVYVARRPGRTSQGNQS